MPAALTFGVAYWATVFAVAFALGTVRTLVVAPAVGATAAVMLELPIILAVSFVAARTLLLRWHLAPRERIAAGGIAFTLLMVAEAVLATTVSHLSVADWAASLVALPGILGLTAQLGFAAMPALVAKAAAA